MLNLRNVVRNLPLLQKALEGSRSQLLQIIHDVSVFIIKKEEFYIALWLPCICIDDLG